MEHNIYLEEKLTFTTLDACGNEIYSYQFSGLKITNRENCFDYNSSEAANHKVTVKYGIVESRENIIK